MWWGFWAVEVPPSPKRQTQDVGAPMDVSVNCTGWPAFGLAENVKLATGPNAGATAITAPSAFTFPAPQVLFVSEPVNESLVAELWSAWRAVLYVNAGFAWSIRATIPVIWGDAWLLAP